MPAWNHISSRYRLLTFGLTKQYRQAIKVNLKERREAVMVEATEAGKSICKDYRSFTNYMMMMIAFRRAHGTVSACRKATEKITHEYYSDLFDCHVHLPSYEIKEDEYVVPLVLSSEIRHAISSVKNRTAPGWDNIKPEHLKEFPPVHVNTLTQLFTRYLSECEVPTERKTSRTVLLFKKGDLHDIGNYRPICLLVVYKLFARVILNRIDRTLGKG
ncbi:unnamed protein product [Angiostrongylus costaricensis]|uniref:RNA-directed RNA polymerase n=1 Tax=Angiostrongylus costaricensis TaxID=334426 RepID=A0A0R3PZ79_ANGCS|nr:unnamed protein product [Angiostrongylus costaricensis]